MKTNKIPFDWRTFKHANSARELDDRYDDDRAEAMEYTSNFSTNRKGHKEIPNIYDDQPVSKSGKWKVKPKEHDHKGGDTIRKNSEEDA